MILLRLRSQNDWVTKSTLEGRGPSSMQAQRCEPPARNQPALFPFRVVLCQHSVALCGSMTGQGSYEMRYTVAWLSSLSSMEPSGRRARPVGRPHRPLGCIVRKGGGARRVVQVERMGNSACSHACPVEQNAAGSAAQACALAVQCSRTGTNVMSHTLPAQAHLKPP